jgi:hypothetical protein
MRDVRRLGATSAETETLTAIWLATPSEAGTQESSRKGGGLGGPVKPVAILAPGAP